MTEKEMRRLSRAELVEMLLVQMQEAQRLQNLLDEAEEKLRSRDILIDKAGSIAEAALQLNDVFRAADAAAAQYLENIQKISNDQEAIRESIIADAQKKANEIIEKAKQTAQAKEEQADVSFTQQEEPYEDKTINNEVQESEISEVEG